MMVQYLFSSTEGDVLLDEKTLNRAFLLNPFEEHPFLTLGDYFRGIERFILEVSLFPDPMDRMLIRSEKHGTLYHVASVETTAGGAWKKFAVSTAFGERRKGLLLREYETMKYLNKQVSYGSIPRVYMASETLCYGAKGSESVVMSVTEWLEGYHEWHLMVEQDRTQTVLIWDMEKGTRTASIEQGRTIFREASRILTLYYDPKTFRQIYPWHHAAGDFVVKTAGAGAEVKLTTARNYLPLISFPMKADTNRVTALVAFLLNLVVQMRLDRIGGVGESIWAHEKFVRPCLEGFFGALQTKKVEGGGDWGEEADLRALLKNFSKEELCSLHDPLMASYREEKPEDFKVIEKNLEGHIATLWRELQASDEASL
ncbi:MAG: hypothetical protein ACM335_05950 [Deltaproteobacteria bacterium]